MFFSLILMEHKHAETPKTNSGMHLLLRSKASRHVKQQFFLLLNKIFGHLTLGTLFGKERK